MTIHLLPGRLRQLKLGGMASCLQSQLEMPGTYEGLNFEERLQLLVEQEILNRDNRKQEKLIRQASFKLRASIQNIEYGKGRNITRGEIARLTQTSWLAGHQNLLITGPCGSGKTWMACAIGQSACLSGYAVKYWRLSRLFLKLNNAKADGTYHRELASLSKLPLLILDDWGMDALTHAQRNDLMEIMDDRHGNASTMVISQLPVEQWYNAIGDNTLADAILDRLVHNAHRLELQGESLRKLMGKVD